MRRNRKGFSNRKNETGVYSDKNMAKLSPRISVIQDQDGKILQFQDESIQQ